MIRTGTSPWWRAFARRAPVQACQPAQALPSWQGCNLLTALGELRDLMWRARTCPRCKTPLWPSAPSNDGGHGAGVSPRRGAAAGGAPCVAGVRWPDCWPSPCGWTLSGRRWDSRFARKNRAPLGAPAHVRLHAHGKSAARRTTPSQHRARILATPALQHRGLVPALPACTQRWLQQASGVQAGIGIRDLLQAGVLAQAGRIGALWRFCAAMPQPAGVPWASQLPGSV